MGRALEIEYERLGTPESYFNRLRNDLYEKRELVVKMIKEAGMKPIVPSGGYFILTDWTPLSKYYQCLPSNLYIYDTFTIIFFTESKIDFNEILKDNPNAKEGEDLLFLRWLLKKTNILGIPPSAFYTEKHKHLAHPYIRFNFYKKPETLQKAESSFQSLKNL